MLVRIANRDDPNHTASDQGLHCLSRPFWQATSVQFLEHLLYSLNSFQMITWMKTVVGTVAFVVPVTISFMDKIGMIVKVEGASMQVYMCIIPCLEVIRFEFILKLKIKCNDWLLADMCPQAANHLRFIKSLRL